MHIFRRMATGEQVSLTENNFDKIIDNLNNNILNAVISRGDGANIVVDRAFRVAMQEKRAYSVVKR
jgi:hypothetical protein